MGKRRRVPEDLMGTILSESFEVGDEERDPSEPRASSGASGSWDEKPERVGMTFNLSKQLGSELERLRGELGRERETRPSRSEIVEVALRIAVEDVRERKEESEVARRLGAKSAGRVAGTVRRSVDESGWIFETIHDENGEIIDEDVIGTVADLPVMDEYVDDRGRLVSLSKDELGNTFEQIMDEGLNTLATRLLRAEDQAAR